MQASVSRSANGPGLPGAIGARAWIRIARVRPPLAGRTALAGAENAGGGTGTLDRGLGPGRYRARGPSRDRSRGSEIIMGDSRGHAPGRSLGSGGAGDRNRGQSLVPVPALALGRARDRGPGRAIRGPVTESAPAALAPEVGPRVTAAAAVENANGEGREVVRRM
jgi:hypothetical protein